MKDCSDIRGLVNLFLDNELHGEERTELEAHLRDCEFCRAIAHTEERFVDTVRHAQPLYVASPELRERVEHSLSVSASPEVNAPRLRVKWVFAVAAVLLLLLMPVIVWRVRTPGPINKGPSSFALMAADTHLRHVRGQLPLEITSTNPQHIVQWFANKVSFRVQIPNYQEASGQEKLYTLEGARLVAYKNDYAAYVAYHMKGRPISLVITSDSVATTSGGEEIKAKNLTFHYNAVEGLKVLTWSDRGLTYALVSDLEERGQQSCVVCHQGSKDQDFIEPLKPH